MSGSAEQQAQHLPSNSFLVIVSLPVLYLGSAMICQFLHGAGLISDPIAFMLRQTVYAPLMIYAMSTVPGSGGFTAVFQWLYDVGQWCR